MALKPGTRSDGCWFENFKKYSLLFNLKGVNCLCDPRAGGRWSQAWVMGIMGKKGESSCPWMNRTTKSFSQRAAPFDWFLEGVGPPLKT